MANWTVTASTTTIAAGASVSGATKVLTITPNTGFTVSASNFKIGNGTETSSGSKTWTTGSGSWNADSGITQVVFADTGTAGSPTNTVTATVTFSSFTMPTSNKTLYLDIDEIDTTRSATAVLRPMCVRTKHLAETLPSDAGVNIHTVTTTSESGITQTDDSSTVGASGTHTYFHKGDVTDAPTTPGNLIFTKVFAANTTYGYYYDATPTFTFAVNSGYGDYSNYYTVVKDSETLTNVVVGGVTISRPTSVTFKGYYTPPVDPTTPAGLDPDPFSTNAAMCELNHYIQFNHVLKQEDQGSPGDKKYITSVVTDTSDILSTGDVRNVRVIGDAGSVFKLVVTITDNGHTYDFSSNSFTAGSTTSTETTLGSSGYQDFDITYPSTSSTDTYDITIVATTPTSTLINVPTTAGDMRISQYAPVVITLDLTDDSTSSSLWDEGEFPAPITITGEAGQASRDEPFTKAFSFTITQAMVTAGGTPDIAPKDTLIWDLDTETSLITLVDGDISSATFDVDATDGITVGQTINWEIKKTPLFQQEEISEIQVGEFTEDTSLTIPPNLDNLTAGMILSASNLRSEDPITITTVNSNSITLSEAIETDPKIPITFTSNGITVTEVTDTNTLVASQSLSGLKDDLSLTFGGTSENASVSIIGGTVVESGDDVIIAGTFAVNSFGNANKTFLLGIDNLVNIP